MLVICHCHYCLFHRDDNCCHADIITLDARGNCINKAVPYEIDKELKEKDKNEIQAH